MTRTLRWPSPAALFALCTIVGSSALDAQPPEPIKFARLAGIPNDGRVAFSYQDDIWVVDADGTNARRLTMDIARDFSPRFSPDGKWIAFTSNRNGVSRTSSGTTATGRAPGDVVRAKQSSGPK